MADRARKWDQDKAIELIVEGKSLREVAAELGCANSVICKRAATDPEFGEQYARAMAIRAEADVAEIPVIRDRMLRGEITPEQARVAIESIKWPASKRLPKVFGDAVTLRGDAKAPLVTETRTSLLDADLERIAAGVDGKLAAIADADASKP